MDLERENIEYSINICKQCIFAKKQIISIKKNNYLSWPLFFVNGTQPREDGVDVCATALGIISCTYSLDGNTENELYNAVKSGISTLLYVRNTDGSWPSKISLVFKDGIIMEGVINDTYYALSALMKIDFISANPKINKIFDPLNNCILDKIEERISIVETGVRWLLENRLGQAWGYTGTKYLDDPTGRNIIPEYIVPSTNAIIILSEIMNIEKIITPKSDIIKEIDNAIHETTTWLIQIQNQDGGYGIKRGEQSKIGNTAKVIIALCSIDVQRISEELINKTLIKAIKYVLKNYNPSKTTFEDVSEEFSQLIVETNDDTINAFKRTIIHELFIEPLIIEAITAFHFRFSKLTTFRNGFLFNIKLYDVAKRALIDLIERQLDNGDIQGAVRCRRPAKYENYTIYACCDLIKSCSRLEENEILTKYIQKVSTKRICFILMYCIIIILALVPTILSEQPLLLALLLVVINPIATSIIGSVIEKLLLHL